MLYLVLSCTFITSFFAFIRYARGAFAHTPDPSFIYLLNGLAVAGAKLPHYVDHPGLTLQYLIAVVIRAFHPFESFNSVVTKVLLETETYLVTTYVLLLLLFLGTLIFTVKQLAKKKGPQVWIFLLLLFAMPGLAKSMHRISPEPILVILSTITGLFIYLPRKSFKWTNQYYFYLFGVMTAFLFFTKMTSITIIFCLPLLFKTKKDVKQWLTGTLLTSSLFITTLIYRFDYYVRWLDKLAFHKGLYGMEGKGFISLTRYLSNFATLLKSDTYVCLFAIVSTILLIRFLLSKKSLKSIKLDEALRKRLIFTLAPLGNLILASKFGVSHYLVPSTGLVIFGTLFFYDEFKGKKASSNTLILPIAKIVLSFCVVLTSYFSYKDITQYAKTKKIYHERVARSHCYYGSSYRALMMANPYSMRWTDKIQAFYQGHECRGKKFD